MAQKYKIIIDGEVRSRLLKQEEVRAIAMRLLEESPSLSDYAEVIAVYENDKEFPVAHLRLRKELDEYPAGIQDMKWKSYWGKDIYTYRLIPEEVINDEGFNEDNFEEEKILKCKTADLEEITIYRNKDPHKDRRIIKIPIGFTTDGRYRACTLVDVEGLEI